MTARTRRMSPPTTAVLRAIVEGSSYGFDIMDATGLPSGTVYPILSRTEKRGFVVSRWEDTAVEREPGRPPRRYYTVTPAGSDALSVAVAHFRTLGEPIPSRS